MCLAFEMVSFLVCSFKEILHIFTMKYFGIKFPGDNYKDKNGLFYPCGSLQYFTSSAQGFFDRPGFFLWLKSIYPAICLTIAHAFTFKQRSSVVNKVDINNFQ